MLKYSARPCLLFVCVTHVVLACMASSCTQGSTYWVSHPDELRVSVRHYDVEPVFDKLAGNAGTAYEIQIVPQNDSNHLVEFAEYRSEQRKWLGDGFTMVVTVAGHPAIESVYVDYANISGMLLWPSEDGTDKRPVVIRVTLSRDQFLPNTLNLVKLTVSVRWSIQDCSGKAVGPSRTAEFYPELVLIGRVGPRPVCTPAQ